MSIRQRPPLAEHADDEPFAALLERFGPEVRQAFDVFHIALIFEAAGVNDRVAAEEYGTPDVVRLATQVAEVAPYVPTVPHRHRPQLLRRATDAVTRGTAFVLAGLMSMTSAAAVNRPGANLVLLMSCLVATTIMSPLSFMAHLLSIRAGAGNRRAALGPIYRWGVLVTAAVGLAVAGTAGAGIALLTVGPVLYAQAAVMALVMQRPWLFALTLAPGGIASTLYLMPGLRLVDADVAAILSIAGIGTLAATMLVRLSSRGRLRGWVGRLERRAAMPFVGAGLATSAFIGSFIVCCQGIKPLESAGVHAWFVAAWPMFVPLGLAEMAVVIMRDQVHAATRTATSAAELAQAVRRAGAWFWGAFTAVALIAMALSIAVQPIGSGGVTLLVPTAFALLALTLIARLADPDPYDQLAPLASACGAVGLMVVAMVDSHLSSLGSAAVMVGVLAATASATWAVLWRRSKSLHAYRWSL